MKNSKKTWGMLGTSMGSMLIIVALLTMVGIGSSDTYAAKKVCTCSDGRWVQGTDRCAITEDENYTCQPGDPNLKACEGEGPVTCTCTRKKTTFVAASCKDIDDSDDTDDKPNKPTPPTGGDDDKPNKPTKPSGGDDDSGKNIGNCPAGTYYLGLNHAATCPPGYYCPGGTYNADTGDIISGCEKTACPAGTTSSAGASSESQCQGNGDKTSCKAGQYYRGNGLCYTCPAGSYCPEGSLGATSCPAGTTSPAGSSSESDCKSTSGNPGDNDNGSSCSKANEPCTLNGKKGTCQASGDGFTCKVPNTPTGGDDKPNNPNKPSGGGDDGLGGNGGGNSGGNGNGGNTGGNNGNNNGGNNATKNPNTATKAPLVIAIIGIMSVGISTVVYFNGKKEINTEI